MSKLGGMSKWPAGRTQGNPYIAYVSYNWYCCTSGNPKNISKFDVIILRENKRIKAALIHSKLTLEYLDR